MYFNKNCDYNMSILLKPKSLAGAGIEYTFKEEGLVITNINQLDSSKRRVEVPWNTLGRFISELQEIEQIKREGK